MAIKKGKGLTFGVGALGLSVGGAPTLVTGSSAVFQSANIRKTASFTELPDEDGDTTGGAFYNQMTEVTVTAVPFSQTSEAAANDNYAAAIAAAIGSQVVVVDAKASILAGHYMIMDIGSPRQNTGFVTVEVTIRSYPIDITATTP